MRYVPWVWTNAQGHASTVIIYTEQFPGPKTPPCSAYSPLPSPLRNLWQPLIFSPYPVSPFPERHVAGLTQYTAFPDCTISRKTVHLDFLHILSWFARPFPLSAAYYPLVPMDHRYLSAHLLRDRLGAPARWQLGIKLLSTSVCRYLCRHRLSTPLGKSQGA